jgi:diaminopimelate epimerase
MKKLSFVKTVGTGNDFILIDGRKSTLPSNLPAFAKQQCHRQRGIGADGILVVARSKKADARMLIFNADGSQAGMCGNGLRCFVWYLHQTSKKKSASKLWTIETGAGLMRARITGNESVRIFLRPPHGLKLGMKLSAAGKKWEFHSVNTGVPHAVTLQKKLEAINLKKLGPAIRYHVQFKPAGTNVNAIRIDSARQISVRTYERGVEGETLACGTGSVASAVVATALGKVKPPVKIKTSGGEWLTVGFKHGRIPWEGLYLEGPVQIVFHGEIER